MHVSHGRLASLVSLPIALSALAGCQGASLSAIPSGAPSVLNPQGPFATSISNLGWFIIILGTLVFIAYGGLVLYGSLRRRQAPALAEPGKATPSLFIPIGGIAIPAVILLITYFFTLNTMNAIPYTVPGAYVVEVTGHQWWWEVHYPDAGVTTANEIHIPAGRPVEIRETSADVIHSFWVPELNGKMDLFPNRTTSLMIQASKPGTYRGECAEFCGTQHAKMDFLVIADSPDQFTQWLDNQKTVPPSPSSAQLRKGQQAFLGSACVYCHSIRGTNASGDLGPDLTHLASRTTIGAGILPNTRGNLAGWIVDAQGIKPGNRMPPIQLDADQLQALLDYLESLK